MDATPARPTRRGLVARGYAAVVVGLRLFIPLAWIAVAVAATVALPGLGNAPAAPLDDLAAKGGSAAGAQALATRTFGFPLATDTAVVQRDPRGLSHDAQRRQANAAQAVRDRRDQALAPIRAAVPISNANVRTPSGEQGTTAITYLCFAPDASLDDETAPRSTTRSRRSAARAPRVVGVTGAAPAREAQFHEIEQALPLIEARQRRAHRADRRPRLPLDRRAAGRARRGGHRLRDRDARAAVARRARERHRAARRSSRSSSCCCSAWSPTTRSSSCPRRAAGCARGDERLPAARGAIAEVAPIVFTAGLIVAAGTAALVVGHLRVLPRLRARAGRHDADHASPWRSRWSPRWWRCSAPRLFGRRCAERRGPAAAPTTPRIERTRAEPRLPRRAARDAAAADAPAARPLRRTGELAREHQTARWRLVVSRVASSRPVALPIALVAVGAAGLRRLARALDRARAEPRQRAAGAATRSAAAGDAASRGLRARHRLADRGRPRGARASPGAARSWRAWRTWSRREPGVAAVVGPREQPPPPAPQVIVSRDGGGARLAVVFDSDPLGAPGDRPPAKALRDRDARRCCAAPGCAGHARRLRRRRPRWPTTPSTRVLDDLARVGVVAAAGQPAAARAVHARAGGAAVPGRRPASSGCWRASG